VRKICIINQKGGVGKTTTTVNIAYGLAELGRKVLVIDLDPQGNIGTCLGAEQSSKDIYSIIIENADVNECIQEVAPNLSVITSRETLTKAELIMAGEQGREQILAKKLSSLQGYDYVFIDCAPSLGLLNQNAMLYCSEAFIPVSTDFLGVDGLKKIMAAINTINDVFEHELVITKVIPTMYDARMKICKESLARIQNDFYEAAANPIRANSKLKESPKHAKPILSFAKSSNGAKDYRRLINHIVHDEETWDKNEDAPSEATEGGMVIAVF
jgi:chromosome partitioning protein